MAQQQAPTCTERRKLLAENSPKLAQAGQAFVSEERYSEALECFKAVNQLEDIDKIAEKALEQGDFFLCQMARKMAGKELTQQEAQQIQDRAQNMGKISYAQMAKDFLDRMDEGK